MNIEEYLNSGIIELYVAGMLSDEESLEVDRMAEKYPVVKQEIQSIRASLNQYAKQTGRAPRPELLASIQRSFTADRRDTNSESGIADAIPEPIPVRRPWLRYAAAVALLLSVGLNVYLYQTLNSSNDELRTLISQNQQMAEGMNNVQNQLSFIQSASYYKIPLQGLQIAPEAYANVYLDKDTRDVYIQIGDLPVPPSGHQYQLWAEKDGHMHNIGVFHHNKQIQHLAVFGDTFESLNVTLEVEGGSENATVEKAYLSGRI
ncbi:MAG: anti-sigma factor [Bacteroidota bacterium]